MEQDFSFCRELMTIRLTGIKLFLNDGTCVKRTPLLQALRHQYSNQLVVVGKQTQNTITTLHSARVGPKLRPTTADII